MRIAVITCSLQQCSPGRQGVLLSGLSGVGRPSGRVEGKAMPPRYTGGWCEPTPGLLDGVERLEPCGEPVSSRGSGSGRAERPDASPVMRPGVIPEPLGPARRLLSQPERPPASWPSGREGAGASSRPGRLPGRSDAIVRSAVGPPVPMSPCYGVAARELYTARAVPRSLESA